MAVRPNRAVISLFEYNIVKSLVQQEDLPPRKPLWRQIPKTDRHRGIWGAMLTLQARVKESLLLQNPFLASVHYHGTGALLAETLFFKMGNRREFFAVSLAPYLTRTFIPTQLKNRARYVITASKLKNALSLLLMCSTPTNVE